MGDIATNKKLSKDYYLWLLKHLRLHEYLELLELEFLEVLAHVLHCALVALFSHDTALWAKAAFSG